MMYGIYKKGNTKVVMFMGKTTYVPAYFFDWEKKEAEETCFFMNSVEPNEYEIREVIL